jgi:hypothetical protein
MLLLIVGSLWLWSGGMGALAQPQHQGAQTYNTLRVYGRSPIPFQVAPPGIQSKGTLGLVSNFAPEGVSTPTQELNGAGDQFVVDELTGKRDEDAPYTDPLDIFNPQRRQAPRKDSITWNPIWMYQNQTFDENQARGLYLDIKTSGIDASEKVWFRMWYEPRHWDKDLNANGVFDLDAAGNPVAPSNPTSTSIDEWYPAIMQEFTYMLLTPPGGGQLRNGMPLTDLPRPTYGQIGQFGPTSFVFPVGQRSGDLFDPNPQQPYGYGLTSFDADFDGKPDIVHVESERTLFEKTGIGADFNGNSVLDPLDRDSVPLSGDELAVLRVGDYARLRVGDRIQFLDHFAQLIEVFDDSVVVDIYYTGDRYPRYMHRQTMYFGDMLLAGTDGPTQLITAVRHGGSGTNLCDFPTGPWFLYLSSVDTRDREALVSVGRALGATHSAMEQAPGAPDRQPGDPWFLKRFYVDGHEYNVTAIHTRYGSANLFPSNQTLPPTVCDVRDFLGDSRDDSEFQFITIRTPIPKVPVRIEQHSVELQDYPLQNVGSPDQRSTPLSVMPPYNHEHYIFEDIQQIDDFATDSDEVAFIGKLVGPVPPILQQNGPVPYTGVGPNSPYSDPRELYLYYVREEKNPQFLGELREKYGESNPLEPPETEFWYDEQFWTLPWEFTEFLLPDIRTAITDAISVWDPNGTAADPDLYMLTSAFLSEEGQVRLWTMFDPLAMDSGQIRVKFWFDPATGGKKYKDANGIRIYGRNPNQVSTLAGLLGSAGDLGVISDPRAARLLRAFYPVEVLPYTDPWAPFNPQLPQAPRQDSLTFNPAYLDEYRNGNEPLSALYRQISIEEQNAREKVYFRMWYEPDYLDKVLRFVPQNRTVEEEIEPNNTCDQSNHFDQTLSRLGAIAPVGEGDFYVFSISRAQWVRIYTDPGPTGDIFSDDATLTLYAGCIGTTAEPQIAFDDDSGPGFQPAIQRYLTPGTYYVLVRGFANNTLIPDYVVNLTLANSVIEAYHFPALVQEFTYILMDTRDLPSHGQPKTSRIAFPMATFADQLPKPINDQVATPSFGYGITSFDANFDGNPDIVTIHSERSLSRTLGVGLDFDGDGVLDQLDTDGVELTGDELAVFAAENIILRRGESAQFLDHMVTLENVTSNSQVQLQFWYTGGGLHPVPGGYSLHPDKVSGVQVLNLRDAMVVRRDATRRVAAGSNNLGRLDGPWFAYVKAINTSTESVVLTIGRALGATHSAMDDGNGRHDLVPGDPWFLKRFFVDGHEYNVVAIKTVVADMPLQPGDELFEFKYITIQTPVPKINFINGEDSQKLEGYHLGLVFGVDTNYTSVMPPFNMQHTRTDDIKSISPRAFANPDFYDSDCVGDLVANVPPLILRIIDEEREPQFFGELKEKYWNLEGPDRWATEQWHTLPDLFTDIQITSGSDKQLSLLTSAWQSDQSRLHFYGCEPDPNTVETIFTQDQLHSFNSGILPTNVFTDVKLASSQVVRTWFYDASYLPGVPVRVKLLYGDVPNDPVLSVKLKEDPYVNTVSVGAPPTSTPTRTPTRTPTGTPPATATNTPIPPSPTPTSTQPTPTPTHTTVPPPNAPGPLLRSAVSQTQINLTWGDNSTDETAFRIERAPNGVDWVQIAGVAANVTNYPDLGLNAGTPYWYRVRAFRSTDGAFSAYSNVVTCVTLYPQGYYDIGGRVLLQGRTDHSGAGLYVDDVKYGTTGSNGAFTLYAVAPGEHTLEATMPGYLPAEQQVTISGSDVTLSQPVTLIGGDAVTDKRVNLFDLVVVGAAYNTEQGQSGFDARADINGSTNVNIFDLVLVGGNYGQTGPKPWPMIVQMVPDTGARVIAAPSQHVVNEGDTFTVNIRIEDAPELFGAAFKLRFDPAVLEVQDADPNRPDVQIEIGNFPVTLSDIEAGQGIAIPNRADNVNGEVVYAATRYGTEPASGSSGVLARITFRAIASGKVSLDFVVDDSELTVLSDRAGNHIPFEPVNDSVTVRWRQFLPSLSRQR